MKDLKIYVATHKEYHFPSDSLYIPIHVGASLSEKNLGYLKDNTEDNISLKNKNYCELTGLYWIWKNTSSEYVGLVHYRRYFSKNILGGKDKFSRILNSTDINNIISKNSNIDIFVPKKRNYYIETNYSQYIHAHNQQDLLTTKQVIQEKYPNYLDGYEKVMNSTSGHRYNMFIMKKSIMDEYCSWLFDILFTVEQRLDISSYSDYDKRVFGFISERLLDVWLETNKYKYKDLPYVYLENINWVTKIYNFFKRKIIAKE